MIILVGPSASGKSEICKTLCFKFNFNKFITTTTRCIRVNEINGVDYHFISKDEFLKKIKENKFIEYVEYNGNYYGTEKNNISDNTVLIIEPNGLKEFKKLNDPSIISFYLNCKKETRKERMLSRLDKLEDIEKRLEIDETKFNYNSIKEYVDYLIDTDNNSVIDLASKINEIYRKRIG